jgi:predicted metalloprotease with PDZ domain
LKSQVVRAAVEFRVEAVDLRAHLFGITLTITEPAAVQRLSLPVWIAGSYLVREFSKHLQNLHAYQGRRRVTLRQLDKHAWQAHTKPGQALVVHYQVYALDNSVRAAWLDTERGFFNGTSLLLQVDGMEQSPHTLEIVASKSIAHWAVATGAAGQVIDRNGFGVYRSENYEALVDCPFEIGAFWSGRFVAQGVPHRFVVAGAPPSFDGATLLADAKHICETHIRFWHGRGKPLHEDYLFMLNAVADGRGGLEHRNSTALICSRKDLPRLVNSGAASHASQQSEGYVSLLGLISHEYFHTWNVKRLRPAEFSTYDYNQENYTSLLWFFEGFTSYYDDLLLLRAGRIDERTYLELLGKTLKQVQQTPGRLVQTVAQASFDAWVKYYRQDENTPNATVSYYTKGALVALCLDLTLRQEGLSTLDAVMTMLWSRCKAGPMTEHDLLDVLMQLGGRSYAAELSRWVHSTSELPVTELLQQHGISIHSEPNPLAQQLGLRVKEAGGLFIQHVLRGSSAEKAGFASGDEWIAVQPRKDVQRSPWRMQTLADLPLYCGDSSKVTALVARDKRLLSLSLTIPRTTHFVRLSIRDAQLAQRWLTNS